MVFANKRKIKIRSKSALIVVTIRALLYGDTRCISSIGLFLYIRYH